MEIASWAKLTQGDENGKKSSLLQLEMYHADAIEIFAMACLSAEFAKYMPGMPNILPVHEMMGK
jgi:hypothetical protein